MFGGHPINNTEDRPALHVALRRPADAPLLRLRRERHAARRSASARRCARSPTRCTPASCAGSRASRSPTSSTSASAAPISASSWPCRRWPRIARPGLSVHFVSNIDGVALAHVLSAGERRDDVVRDLLEDLHDARDARQREGRARMAARRRRQGSRRRAMRGGVDQRSRDERVRHRGRPASRDVGLGRRPLLGLVGRRPDGGARDRLGRSSRRSSPAELRWTSISAARRSRAICPCSSR